MTHIKIIILFACLSLFSIEILSAQTTPAKVWEVNEYTENNLISYSFSSAALLNEKNSFIYSELPVRLYDMDFFGDSDQLAKYDLITGKKT
jgi:hypothetical protein